MKQNVKTVKFYCPIFDGNNGMFFGGRDYTIGKNANITGIYKEENEVMYIQVQLIKWKIFKKLAWVNEDRFIFYEEKYYNCREVK